MTAHNEQRQAAVDSATLGPNQDCAAHRRSIEILHWNFGEGVVDLDRGHVVALCYLVELRARQSNAVHPHERPDAIRGLRANTAVSEASLVCCGRSFASISSVMKWPN